MKTGHPSAQRQFDFTPRPRPFLANLPAGIDTYESGVARYFQWRTGLDYYATTDQIIEFVINTKRTRIVDLLTDTGAFALRLVGRKAFGGRVLSFDTNITLLERARQRARYQNLLSSVDFRQFEEPRWPVSDGSADVVVSIFDFHRRSAEQFLQEAIRILVPEGHLILAEMIEPNSRWNRFRWTWRRLMLRYVRKNPGEAEGVYYDREEIIRLLFEAGFRQVVMQGLNPAKSAHDGVFSLIAATK